ncbi:MAG: threonylcarbamoyl-AMP synthase [Candidatus Omnitrophica bacterium]|nr:threonylcarbamoyl-AMP synthase [Candidatus Omnitrophota bacterium]
MNTKVIKLHPQFPDLKEINTCAKIIRNGGLVIFPTETVYGIAADNTNEQAIKRLRELKKRPDNKPFSVLISQRGLITNYTNSTDPRIYKLIDAFWPGPVTLVVPAKESDKTIGVRMPDNVIALRLMAESQCPVAAPSANISGKKAPVTCEEALEDFNGLVDVAIDGGEAPIGKGSTVVDMTKKEISVLREGVIAREEIENVVRKKNILFVCTGNSCRSVMADYLLKNYTKDMDYVEVESAGTSVFLHSTASAETVSVLREEEIDASKHLSQPINSILLRKADLIFVMTRAHRGQVLERVPAVEKRVYLLKEFANIPASFETDLDIPDPIGQSREAYRECLLIIKECIKKIVQLI